MANGHPRFGDGSTVPYLDLGQVGGTRYNAGQALFSGRLTPGRDEVATVKHVMPQQNVAFVDVIGFTGRRVTIDATIRTDTTARMDTIVNELNERKHGSGRNADTGDLDPADPAMVTPTKLTDYDGSVLSSRARLLDWTPRGPRTFPPQGAWAVIQKVELVFECL